MLAAAPGKGVDGWCVCMCVYVSVFWQEGAVLITDGLLSGLSLTLVPMAQLAPALTVLNPWDKARKTGRYSECMCVSVCLCECT